MFLKNKNIIFKIRRSKVTDYAALSHLLVYSLIVFKYMNLIIRKEKIHLRENWLIFGGIWGESELIFRIWGAKENTFRDLRKFLLWIWGD